MNESAGYATPAAFRRALTDRLKALASGSRWPLPQLQQQIAYDRLLERLDLADDQWIVKGATALLARDLGVRATIDVDFYRPQAAQTAEAQLRAAAQRDIGDWFRFEIGPAQPVTAGTTSRLPVTAVVGVTVWVSFHVDLAGEDLRMTGRPDDVPPPARVLMPGIQHTDTTPTRWSTTSRTSLPRYSSGTARSGHHQPGTRISSTWSPS